MNLKEAKETIKFCVLMTAPGIDIHEEAIKVTRQIWDHYRLNYPPHDFKIYVDFIEQGLARVRKEALEEAALLADWRTLPPCPDPLHGERWCLRCEAIKDAADIIEHKIKSSYGQPQEGGR